MKRNEVKSAINVVMSYFEAKEQSRQIVAQLGPKLIEHACSTISLRELGRRTGLSITYLSLAKNNKQALSPDAFLSIARAIEKGKSQT